MSTNSPDNRRPATGDNASRPGTGDPNSPTKKKGLLSSIFGKNKPPTGQGKSGDPNKDAGV